jgi:hypothetical protein
LRKFPSILLGFVCVVKWNVVARIRIAIKITDIVLLTDELYKGMLPGLLNGRKRKDQKDLMDMMIRMNLRTTDQLKEE